MMLTYAIDDYCNVMHYNTNCKIIASPSSRQIARVEQTGKEVLQRRKEKIYSVGVQGVKFRPTGPIKDRHIANVFGFRRKRTFTDKFDRLNKCNFRGASNPKHHNCIYSSELSPLKHKSGNHDSLKSEGAIVISPENQTNKFSKSSLAKFNPSSSLMVAAEQLTTCFEVSDKGRSLSGQSEDIDAIIVRDLGMHGPSEDTASQVGGFLRKLTTSTIENDNHMRPSYKFLSRKMTRIDGRSPNASANKINTISSSQNS
jgi:hypothetical protein